MQTHLSDHLHGIVMAQLTIKKKVHDLESITNLLQQALNVLLDKTQRWAESQQFPLTVGSSYTSDVGTCLAGSLNEPVC